MLVELAIILLLFQAVVAQLPPRPENVTRLNSKFGDGVYISYKEVNYPVAHSLPVPLLTAGV